MLDKSGIHPGYIRDISEIYPGFIYIPDKFRIYPKHTPKYIPNISGIYSQIYLGFQGWGVPNKYLLVLSKEFFYRYVSILEVFYQGALC